MNGARLFARFALPPNELGYCGPAETTLIEELMLAGEAGLDELRHTAQAFAGAWPYLELIAGCSGLDPLDPRVVEAYWIGNELLDRVDILDWGNALDARFRGRAGSDFAAIVDAIEHGGSPNHAFHVFCVYPWVGLLGGGDGTPALRVLDRCRIRTGRVIGFEGAHVIVESNRLVFDGRSLTLSGPVVESARTPVEPWLPVGGHDLVALHWNTVCQPLSTAQYVAIHVVTDRHLAIANRRIATSARIGV